ncbi:MAG: hypothetical protein Fur009_6120 [Candidatus Microgenomates bacterium]
MTNKKIIIKLKNILLLLIVIIIYSLLFIHFHIVFSQEPNNKFGIHLAQPHFEDLKKVKELVNSNGGDWGYVTLVIQENDRNLQKWQEIFNLLRKYHLIPIVRLATSPQAENWRRPKIDDVSDWVNFLDSLNWVVKNRYIILFNEPNHATEWGGEADPQDYGKIAFAFAKALKEKNKDFFVMLAGFDASAPQQPPKYWDEEMFLKEMFNYLTIEQFNNFISGWISHSYPNPSFSGSPYDRGRGTIRTYEWELQFLKNLGVNKDLPVFITETGWENKVKSSKSKVQNYLIEETIANNYKIAFKDVWLNDDRVKAVTPFVFDYQAEPFLGFSWKKIGGNYFYPQYFLVQGLQKLKGEPEQIEKGKISFNLPKELVEQSTYNFKINLKNEGQGYWEDNSYLLVVNSYLDNKKIEVLFDNLEEIAPGEEKKINFYLKTKDQGEQKLKFFLSKNGKNIIESQDWQFKILPLPSLKFEVLYWPWGRAVGDDFEVQIFDWEEKLVFKKKNISLKNGIGFVDNIKNITLNDLYRVVIIKKGYLPRQVYYVFRPLDNQIKFKKLLPFDLNGDGKLSFADLFWWRK